MVKIVYTTHGNTGTDRYTCESSNPRYDIDRLIALGYVVLEVEE